LACNGITRPKRGGLRATQTASAAAKMETTMARSRATRGNAARHGWPAGHSRGTAVRISGAANGRKNTR
jgi:hypothetical protein